MHKKILALLCATTMTLSLVACGNGTTASKESQNTSTASQKEQTSVEAPEEKEEPKDPVEITYWYKNNVGVQEYTDEVEAKINELLANTEGYEHITLKLHPCKDYATDIALAQSSGEQIDVLSTVNLSWTTEAVNGAILPLDDLIAENPEITEELPEWFTTLGTMDGVTYMVPNYQQMVNQYFWVTPTEWFEQSGYTYEEIQKALFDRDFDKLAQFTEDYVLAVRKYTGKDTKWLYPSMFSYPYNWTASSNSCYDVTSAERFYYNLETGEIECTYLNEDIQNAWRKEAEWYIEGLNYPNQIVDKITTNVLGDIMNDESYVIFRVQGMGSVEMAEEQFEKSYGYDCTVFAMEESFYIPEKNAAGGVAISATTEHPEDAAKVIALLFNSKYEEVYNTLAYGIEGIHYEANGDGTITTLEFSGTQGGADTTYCYWKWVGGNTFNAWLNQSMTQEQEDFVLNEINENEDNVLSPLMGMTLDTSNVENELAQIKTLHTEYINSLRYGIYGEEVDKYIDEFVKKLEAAGLQKVLDDFNAQVDEFLGR